MLWLCDGDAWHEDEELVWLFKCAWFAFCSFHVILDTRRPVLDWQNNELSDMVMKTRFT